jgi:UDP:flavonoid glycosyltransferase YjiC (YdhE family)
MSRELIRTVIDPCPPAIEAPFSATRLPVRFLPYNGTGEVPDSAARRGERRRVCVAWRHSLVRMLGPKSFILPQIAEALAELDVDVLFAVHPDAVAMLGSVPANATVLGYTPLSLVLPHCDAVVHNAGSGCMMTAAAVGVPQLALYFTPETTLTAQRLAATGAVLAQDGPSATAEQIREGVVALLQEPAYGKAAAGLAEDMAAAPTPAELFGHLEQLAGR